MEITPSSGELVGIFIGDGFANKYGSSYIVEFTGNSKNEVPYFDGTIIPLVSDVFGARPHLRIVGNAIRLRYNSKAMLDGLVEAGLPTGEKSATVSIPDVFLVEEEVSRRVLRGIADTDGSVVWDRRASYRAPYPRISFNIASPQLASQISQTLASLGFRPTSRAHTRAVSGFRSYYVDIYGRLQTRKWMKEIGFSNPKNILRVNMPQ